MKNTYKSEFLRYIEDSLGVYGELPEFPLEYSNHALKRFEQRHSDVAASAPKTLKITRDNILVVNEGDEPNEVIVKVSVPLYKKDEDIPTYYLAFVVALKEAKSGVIDKGVVITTFPYDRAQHLIKSLGWGRRAEKGKFSFKAKRRKK